MSLDLDPLQRAMLAEMGVRVWTPSDHHDAPIAPPARPAPAPSVYAPPPSPASASQPRPQAVAPTQATAISAPIQTPATTSTTLQAAADTTGTTGLSAFALRDAVASCQACAQGRGRKAAVLPGVAPAQHANWMVVGDQPDDAQERVGQPFVGNAGVLLDNMLKAVGVQRRQPEHDADPAVSAYLALTLKCRPRLPAAPQRSELDTCARHLRDEIALVRPKVIVSMGRLAMQVLLSEDHPQGLKLPLAKLRGRVWHYQGVPVVVTYPPSYLLLNGLDKARAWEDLCLAADVAQGKLPPG